MLVECRDKNSFFILLVMIGSSYPSSYKHSHTMSFLTALLEPFVVISLNFEDAIRDGILASQEEASLDNSSLAIRDISVPSLLTKHLPKLTPSTSPPFWGKWSLELE